MDADEVTFTRLMGNSTTHAVKLKQHLHDQLLAQSEFCDVTLSFSGVEMKAHWCVLVACPYFQSLYNSGLSEKQQGKVYISIGKLCAIRQAITFLYTGMITITYSTLKDILEIADYLQIDDLVLECTNFLNNVEIRVDNCVNLCLLASSYDLYFYNRFFDYIRGHLPEVMQQPDALSLTAPSILIILKDPSLNYVERADLFNFIVKWVNVDREKRREHFESMFCELNLQKIPRSVLESDVETCDLVAESDKCSVHLLNVKMKHMAGLLPADDLSDVMLLVGGCAMASLHAFYVLPLFFPISQVNTVYAYVIEENRWAELAPLPSTMKQPIIAFKQSTACLYAYDGSTDVPGDEKSALIQKYDLVAKTWSTMRLNLPDPLDDITVHSIHILGSNVEREYIIASGRSSGPLEPNKSPEFNVFIFGVKNGMTQCYMFTRLCARNFKTEVQVCTADNRYICILCFKCGKSCAKRNKTTRFFLFDTHTGTHKEYSRGSSHDQMLFAIKNEVYSTKQGCNRFKKFDTNTKKWTGGMEMLIPLHAEHPSRSEFVHGTHDNKLFLFGGKNETKLVNVASSCDFTSKTWKDIEPVPKAISGSAVMAAKLPASVVSCYIDCPHCKFVSVISRASYAGVEYPEEEEDDDFDEQYSYDDEEDMYSDFYENEVYDLDLDMYPDFNWY